MYIKYKIVEMLYFMLVICFLHSSIFEKLNKSLILISCTVGIIMRLKWTEIKFLLWTSVCTVSVIFHKIFEEFQQWKMFSDGCSFLVIWGCTTYSEKNALQTFKAWLEDGELKLCVCLNQESILEQWLLVWLVLGSLSTIYGGMQWMLPVGWTPQEC